MRHSTLFLFAMSLVALRPCALAQDPVVERLKGYRFGDDPAITQSVSKRVDEARENPTLRAQVARALGDVLKSNASFDAKQHACRMLVYIGSEEEVPALASLLNDEKLGHYAVMALSRIPGSSASEALRTALVSAPKVVRIEAASQLGLRMDAAAIPPLSRMLQDTDHQLVEVAASGLAQITAGSATEALVTAYKAASGARRNFLGDSVLHHARRWQADGNMRMAAEVFAILEDSERPILRAAALRGLAPLRGASVLTHALKALRDENPIVQSSGAEVARSLPGPDTARLLSASLPSLTARGKLMLVTALADRGDRSAAPAVSALTKDADPAVRLAAIKALGKLGTAASVPSLVQAAATGKTAEKEAARSSMARLADRATDANLASLASSGPPAHRAEAIMAIGQRGSAAAMPQLLAAAKDRSSPVSTAAARVLRDVSRPEHLPALVNLFLASPEERRPDLSEAVAETARRGTTDSERTGPILRKLSGAKPADRADLFLVLRQVGGAPALAAIRSGLRDPSPEVRTAAIRQLAEWPSDAPMADLMRAFSASKDRRERTLALRGYIRMIGLGETRTLDQAFDLYEKASKLATTPDEKRLILGGIGKVGSLEALQLARDLGKEHATRDEAELAITEIARFTAGAYPAETRAALAPIAAGSSGEEARNRARAILGIIDKYGDFVTAWEVSPAYQRGGLGYTQLFDTAFPPEVPAQQGAVPWRLMPAGTPEQPWLLDLLALYPGDQKVAYLRTVVWAQQARDAVLELGSDDGLKVWLNGRVVLAYNTARAVAPGQERVRVELKAGRNDLLLKVSQNVMGWGAAARFANPDGSPATGLRFVPGLRGVIP